MKRRVDGHLDNQLKLVYPDLNIKFDYELDPPSLYIEENKIDIYIPDLKLGFKIETNIYSSKFAYDWDCENGTYETKERLNEYWAAKTYGIELHSLWMDDHNGRPYGGETVFRWIDNAIQSTIKEQGKDPNQYPYTNPTKVKEEAERKAKEKERIYNEWEGKVIEIVIGVIFGLVILGSILNAMNN